MRGCGMANEQMNCGDDDLGVCTCTTDLCNGADKAAFSAAKVVLAVAAALLSRMIF